MFKLQKDFRFEAAHFLPNHDGKCARLHGHSWKGTAVLEGDTLIEDGPKQGMLLDYSSVKAALEPLVEEHLDHFYLNDTVDPYPTSERVARWVFEKLKPSLPQLVAVIIEETCTARCEYRP